MYTVYNQYQGRHQWRGGAIGAIAPLQGGKTASISYTYPREFLNATLLFELLQGQFLKQNLQNFNVFIK